MITFAANFLCCRSRAFSNFFCRLSLSFLLNSSGGIGSPLQLWGWALCAGLPGPFFVCSFFLHFALLFWNHTWKQTNRIWLLSVLKRKHSWRKIFLKRKWNVWKMIQYLYLEMNILREIKNFGKLLLFLDQLNNISWIFIHLFGKKI